MIRAIAAVVSAMNVVAPSFPHGREAAELIRDHASEYGFDPLTLVAYVESESRWDPTAVGSGGSYLGLGQVRIRNYDECRLSVETDGCRDVVDMLLDWRANLRETSRLFWTAREYCRDVVGSAKLVHWMSLVKGYDKTRRTTCGHRRVGRRWVVGNVPTKVTALRVRIGQLASL